MSGEETEKVVGASGRAVSSSQVLLSEPAGLYRCICGQ